MAAKQAAKAIYSALVAGLTAVGGYLVNDTSFADITAGQWVFVALAALTAGGGVYAITNAVPPPE
jgi:hypothetical protein